MNKLFDRLAQITKFNELDKKQSLSFLEKQHPMLKPSRIVLSFSILLLIIVLSLDGVNFLVSLLCFAYPAYLCTLHFEDQGKQYSKKYLIYWIVFVFLQILSPILRWIFSNYFYILIRLLIAFLFLKPQLRLAQKLYDKFLRKFFSDDSINVASRIPKIEQVGKIVLGEIKKNV